jgi:hypothetical protein
MRMVTAAALTGLALAGALFSAGVAQADTPPYYCYPGYNCQYPAPPGDYPPPPWAGPGHDYPPPGHWPGHGNKPGHGPH